MRNIFDELFDKWLVASPDGRKFQPMPWEVDGFSAKRPLVFYDRPYGMPAVAVAWILFLMALFSFVFHIAVAGGFAIGALVVWIFACRDSWLQSASLSIEPLTTTFRVQERETFNLCFKVKNLRSNQLNSCHLFIKFDGAVKRHQVFCISALAQNEGRQIDVAFNADAGMGIYKLSEVQVVTFDFLGILPRCVYHEVDVTVEVLPESQAMPPISLHVAGKTAHSGIIEARLSGDSASFLGLRPFRNGDSIRRINWKKTERFNSLIVRDFERLSSTDATIMIDQRSVGLFDFDGLNSFEHLKDAVMSLCRSLMNQRLRVRLITSDFVTDFGKGDQFFEYVSELVRDLQPNSIERYEVFLTRHRELVAPDSLVIPVFCAIDMDLASLSETFWAWDTIHSQIMPVVIDIPSFDQRIAKSANLDANEHRDLTFLRQLYSGLNGGEPYENLARKLSQASIVIGPGESIGQVYERNSRWSR